MTSHTRAPDPEVTAFFDEATNTVSYVVRDRDSTACAIIDSVLDFDAPSGRTSTDGADRIVQFVRDHALEVVWILETHVHADHLTAAPYLHQQLGGAIAIGAQITQVQQTFADIFNESAQFARDGSQFGQLLHDEQQLALGDGCIEIMHTPGHTPACLTYVIGDAAFVGDTIFMPDYGTARCDFPGGSAADLWDSLQKILALPESTRLFMCHDYKAPGRDDYAWETTVREQRASNKHVHDGVTRQGFIDMREKRDAQLSMPRLLLPSIQVNMRAGHLPPPESNGVSYLKLPLNAV